MAMTPSKARVVNPVLSQVARGYQNQDFVGTKLFPFVPVAQRGGTVIEFGKDKFILEDTARAPGAHVSRSDVAFGSSTYALRQHAIAKGVPVEHLEEAAAVPGIDMATVAINDGMQKILLKLEHQQATLARDANKYHSDNKITLSGSTQWSHADSDPALAVKTARSVISSKTGMYPNTLLLAEPVFSALTVHPKILDRIKYTGTDSITEKMLAQLLGVDEVVVGKAVYLNASGAFVRVWGKDAVLAYTAPGTLAAMGTPSYGYTYRLRQMPVVETPHYDPDTRSYVYTSIDEHAPVMPGPDAGYLFTNAVA